MFFSGANEFVLYSTHEEVYRVMLDGDRKERISIPAVNGVRFIEAIEYSYHDNCVYWADVAMQRIEVG